MIALQEAIEVLLQEVQIPPAFPETDPANSTEDATWPGEARAILQFLYSSYAVVLPLVLGLGLMYLFIVGEIGLAAAVAAVFALVSFTATAVVLRDRPTESG